MAFEPVDVVVSDTTVDANPVAGVLVKVYDEAGAVVVTQAITDADGTASFLLETGFTWQLRFFKFATSIPNPLYIEVLEAPATNVFDVSATVFVAPLATDPRFCRVSGYFRTASGAPLKHLEAHITPKFDPLILDGNGVLHERLITATDLTGYLQVDLIRFAQYELRVEGLDDMSRRITVPDSAFVNAMDLFFPVVVRVEFFPAGPFTVGVDDTLEITPTVYTSDLNTLDGTADEDVVWGTADPTVAVVEVGTDTLVLRGIAAGATTLTATRRNLSIVRIPDSGVTGSGTVIIVS